MNFVKAAVAIVAFVGLSACEPEVEEPMMMDKDDAMMEETMEKHS